MICPDCHKECSAHIVDNGIGPYEFWGAKGWDSRTEVESDCCDAYLEIDPSEVMPEPDYD